MTDYAAFDQLATLIAVVRPDGNDLRVVTTGADAAWTSGSDSLYFRRDNDGLFRVGLDGDDNNDDT